ncbi:MAG: hypothetical protein WCA23_30555 [Stellaceae bacterium]
MEYIKLGRTGLDVSRICLGCMSYGGGNRNHAWSMVGWPKRSPSPWDRRWTMTNTAT